jgi:hypothetical protein
MKNSSHCEGCKDEAIQKNGCFLQQLSRYPSSTLFMDCFKAKAYRNDYIGITNPPAPVGKCFF